MCVLTSVDHSKKLCNFSNIYMNCPSVVREVWHEQTVRKLSQLIDLPLLEGVLNCAKIVSPPSRGSNSEPDLLYTSNYLDRQVLKAFKESQ